MKDFAKNIGESELNLSVIVTRSIVMRYLNLLNKNKEFEYWQGASDLEISHIEESLGIILPEQYKIFLSECGMCNFGDVNILGIAKSENQISYPVIEATNQLREEIGIPKDFIVISYELGEYLILYQTESNQTSNGSKIYGVEIGYNSTGKLFIVGKPEEIFASFEEYFDDFLELGS